MLRVWLFNRSPAHHANLCSKKAAAVSEPPLSLLITLGLVINDLRSIGNIVVNPFGMVGRKPDASRGRTLSHSGVHHVKRPRIARLCVEQIVTVELRIIPAGICIGTERFSTTGYFEIAGYGWCGIFTRRTGQVLHCCPAAVLTVKYNSSAGVGICHDQPVCITLCRSCSGSNGTGNAHRY